MAWFEDEKVIFSESLSHSVEDLRPFASIADQKDFRLKLILLALKNHGQRLSSLDAVVGRGGLLRPIPGGTYIVSKAMLHDLEEAARGEHASNLGAIIAFDIGKEANVPAFIVDPVVVDEMEDVARISGMPEIERVSIFHALNQKAVARRAAGELGKPVSEIQLIVAHLGGGISVGCHCRGRVVDVNNALNGEGPFSPERSGGLPSAQLAELCFSGQFTKPEILKKIYGKGGMVAYLGTNDMKEVTKKIESGDKKARLVYEAMSYQVAKEIGSLAAVLKGKVDGIVITGGLAFDSGFVDKVRERVDWIARVFVYPGEGEMESLATGALRILRKEEKARTY